MRRPVIDVRAAAMRRPNKATRWLRLSSHALGALRYALGALTAAALLTCGSASAQTSAIAAAVQQQGNALAAALLHEDYATIAATMCTPVLARVGGAEALARQIEVSFKVMQQQGRQLVQMQFDAASALFDAAQTRFALVPYRSVVRVRNGHVSLASYYLGVQNKGADAWCFIDTAALTADSLHELFPGAPVDLKLPEQAQAIVQRDVPN